MIRALTELVENTWKSLHALPGVRSVFIAKRQANGSAVVYHIVVQQDVGTSANSTSINGIFTGSPAYAAASTPTITIENSKRTNKLARTEYRKKNI